MNQALEQLRQATAGRHARLDQALPLALDRADLADYRDHLLLIRAWLAPREDWLAGFDDGPQDAALLPHPRRAALIDRDLADAAFMVLPPPPAVFAQDLPPFTGKSGAAFRWGLCYVIEGSQLGGAVLLKKLSLRLAPHPLHYLRGEPGGPGRRWQTFVTALVAGLHTSAARDEACEGACEAFDALTALAASTGLLRQAEGQPA